MTDNIIDLERHRQKSSGNLLQRITSSLPPGAPLEKIHAMLDRSDAHKYVQSLNPHALFRLIKEAGWEAGFEIIPYASTWQIQTFLDLDCWNGSNFSVKKLEPWLASILEDTPDQQFKQIMRDLDPEVVGLLFKTNLQVELIEDEEIPPHLTGDVRLSPDNAYAIVYPEDEVTATLMHALVQRIYAVDFALAWTLLEAARWELHSEMEEMAYHWRKSRLEEFGYVTPDEAMQVYRYINPVQLRERFENHQHEPKYRVRPPETIDLPSVIESQVDSDFFFFNVLHHISDDTQVRELLYELSTLINWAMIADGIEPGEIESGQEVTKRSLGYLSLGLEFLSRDKLDSALKLLQQLSLKQIFQAGYSLTRKLQLKVSALQSRPTLTIVEGDEFSLLNADDTALCEALLRPRPTFAENALVYDIFRRQTQLDSAALRIGKIAFKQLWLFGVQKFSPESLAALIYDDQLLNQPIDATFDSLFTSAVATTLLHNEATIRGLSTSELNSLIKILSDQPWQDDMVGYFEPLIGPIMVTLPGAATHLATAWLSDTLKVLTDELLAIIKVDNPELLTTLLLITRD